VFFTIFLAAQQCSQGNTYFSWRPTKTAKENSIFLATRPNSQGNTYFSWRLTKIAKKIFFLAVRCYCQGNVIFLGG